MLMALCRNTCDVIYSEARKTTLGARICSVQLSPCFLKQAYPKLTITARCKDRLSILVTRKVVINDDRRFLAIEDELDQIDACCINLFRHEHLLDIFWELSEGAQGSQEVAVSELSLVNVVGLDTVLEDVDWVVDLSGASPRKGVIHSTVNLIINSWIVERGTLRTEIGVGIRLACFNSPLNESLHLVCLHLLLCEGVQRLLASGFNDWLGSITRRRVAASNVSAFYHFPLFLYMLDILGDTLGETSCSLIATS